MVLTTSWKEEGRVEGRVEEAAAIALRLLPKHIGGLSETQETQVRRLPLPSLETLLEAMYSFTKPSDLDGWIQTALAQDEP